jgi:C4-dicarboxylate-specific signal transduction histidine kinase
MFIFILASGAFAAAQFFRFASGHPRTKAMLVVGVFLFLAAASNDVLTEFGLLSTGYFSNVGVGGLCSCIAAIALTNHVATLRRAESASEDLKVAVTAKSLELVDVQARFLQEHQLASLGRLSAGIAHEINNPLAAIQANLTFIEEALPAQHDRNIDAALTESFEACQKASQIVKDLSLFARRRPTKAARTRLAPPVGTALRFLSRAYPNAQRVTCSFDSSVEVIGDEAKIAQIATNLIENALHAVESLPQSQGKVEVTISRRSQHALLVVADNGPGVPAEKRTQIFEPFFTTKDIGRGTGLGLAICARLVDDHRGTVRVEDNPGGGARFVVEFPLA